MRTILSASLRDSAGVAGHSIAGAQMTRLAATHPTRAATLVHLDAAVDDQASAALAREAPHPRPGHRIHSAWGRRAQPGVRESRAPGANSTVVFDGRIPARPNDPGAYKRCLRLS